jgi:hypothetical protein
MPQSLARVVVHMIFSTKDRQPFITPEFQKELCPYASQFFATKDIYRSR